MEPVRAVRIVFLVSCAAISGWFSFVQSPVLFREFPTLAGEIQEVIFPWYWGTGYFLIGFTAMIYLINGLARLKSSDILRAAVLVALVACIAVNQFALQPKISDLRDILRSSLTPATQKDLRDQSVEQSGAGIEFEEARRRLARARNDFGLWHGTSLLLNFFVFAVVSVFAVRELLHKPRHSRFT